MRVNKSRILFIMLSVIATACITVEICDDDNNSVMVAKFMTLKDGVPADSLVSAFSLYGIRDGLPDSLIYNNGTAISAFEAPLDAHNNFTRFVVQIGELTDTLELNHHQDLYMISYDCGFGNMFTLETVGISSGMIKSAEIKDEIVDAETEADDEHIWLFL